MDKEFMEPPSRTILLRDMFEKPTKRHLATERLATEPKPTKHLVEHSNTQKILEEERKYIEQLDKERQRKLAKRNFTEAEKELVIKIFSEYKCIDKRMEELAKCGIKCTYKRVANVYYRHTAHKGIIRSRFTKQEISDIMRIFSRTHIKEQRMVEMRELGYGGDYKRYVNKYNKILRSTKK